MGPQSMSRVRKALGNRLELHHVWLRRPARLSENTRGPKLVCHVRWKHSMIIEHACIQVQMPSLKAVIQRELPGGPAQQKEITVKVVLSVQQVTPDGPAARAVKEAKDMDEEAAHDIAVGIGRLRLKIGSGGIVSKDILHIRISEIVFRTLFVCHVQASSVPFCNSQGS